MVAVTRFHRRFPKLSLRSEDMSKKPFKSQASSARAVSGAFGGAPDGAAFGISFGAVASSPLSYVYEPPDLSRLAEPNIVVAFKNLQKKDATTKAKALEDLQSYVSSLETGKGALEEAMLEAWVCLLAVSCTLQ